MSISTSWAFYNKQMWLVLFINDFIKHRFYIVLYRTICAAKNRACCDLFHFCSAKTPLHPLLFQRLTPAYTLRLCHRHHLLLTPALMTQGGLYLPLEHPASQCIRDPLFVAYWNGHFVPLLTTDHEPHASRRATQSPRSCDLVPIGQSSHTGASMHRV